MVPTLIRTFSKSAQAMVFFLFIPMTPFELNQIPCIGLRVITLPFFVGDLCFSLWPSAGMRGMPAGCLFALCVKNSVLLVQYRLRDMLNYVKISLAEFRWSRADAEI
jgi:hypothetical protein